ncbi:hypothetical protein BJ165DRAFT_1409964 [Panaeolus papilionaceus]|nr:hypothetical protein BJ165DRAFT_1409964 [Panaeolus papilionaceus]
MMRSKKSKVIVINCVPQTYGPGGPLPFPYAAGLPYASPQWPTNTYITSPYTVVTSLQQQPYASPVQGQPQQQQPWPVQIVQQPTPVQRQQPVVAPTLLQATPSHTYQLNPATPAPVDQLDSNHSTTPQVYHSEPARAYQSGPPSGFQPFQSEVCRTPSIKVQRPSPRLSPLDILQPPAQAAGETQSYIRLHHRTPLIHTQTPTSVLEEELARRESCINPSPASSPNTRLLDSRYPLLTPTPLQPRPRYNSNPIISHSPSSVTSQAQDTAQSRSPQSHEEAVEVIRPERSSLLQNTTLCAPEAALSVPSTSTVTPRVTFNHQPHRTMLFDPEVPVSSMMGSVSLPNSPGNTQRRAQAEWQQSPATPHARVTQSQGYAASNHSAQSNMGDQYYEESVSSRHPAPEERKPRPSPSKYHNGNYLPTPPLSYRSSRQLSSSPPSSPEPQTPQSCSSRRSRLSSHSSRKGCCTCACEEEVERRSLSRGGCRRRVASSCCEEDEEDEEQNSVVYIRGPGSSCSKAHRRGRSATIEIRC